MLEYGDIGIKDSDDLVEAIKSGMNAHDFKWFFKAMVERWGLDSATSMLGDALFNPELLGIEAERQLQEEIPEDSPNKSGAW